MSIMNSYAMVQLSLVINNNLKPADHVTRAKPDVSLNSQTVSSTGIQASLKLCRPDKVDFGVIFSLPIS